MINKFVLTFESFVNEDVMKFWHGGNLDNFDYDVVKIRKNRYVYGAGLNLTTSYDLASRYAKGSRKLYLVTVEKGNDIQSVKIPYDKIVEFVTNNVPKSKHKIIFDRLVKFNDNNLVDADILNNIFLNESWLPSTKMNLLVNFLVENNVDYEVSDTPYNLGGKGKMMVLYNMNKVKDIKRIYSSDKFDVYDLSVDNIK